MQQGARPWALALLINWAPAELGKGPALLIRHWSLLIRGRVRWSLRRPTSVLYYIDKYLWCISYWQTIVFFISLTCSLSLCLTNMCGFIWYIILTRKLLLSGYVSVVIMCYVIAFVMFPVHLLSQLQQEMSRKQTVAKSYFLSNCSATMIIFLCSTAVCSTSIEPMENYTVIQFGIKQEWS